MLSLELKIFIFKKSRVFLCKSVKILSLKVKIYLFSKKIFLNNPGFKNFLINPKSYFFPFSTKKSPNWAIFQDYFFLFWNFDIFKDFMIN